MPKLSPIRMFANSPMKTAQSSGAPDLVENEAPGRVPLCPIQETSGLDSSTPRGTRGKKAQAFNPLSENANDSGNSTPEKRALAACNPRSKFGWYQHQAKVDCAHDELGSSSNKQMEHNTPSRIVRPVELGHHSVQLVNKHGGASQYSTPRASKIDNKHFQMYSEPGSNSGKACNSTPKKSVSRSLKYNQELGSLMRVGGPQGTVVKSIGFSQARGVTQALDNSLPAHFELEEDLSFWQDHNVQVLIRVRPLSFTEISLQGQGRCLRQDTAHSLTWTGPPESRFTFDHVACETITQDKLFRVAGLPMVENCISGYNNCMFAYGQTGSGKTHTMLGDIADIDQKQSEDRGMIPRVFEYLFVRIQLEEEARKQEHLKFACKCSFLEIYNEQITDLLEPSSTNLQMREDAKKGVYVEDLTEVEVNSVQDVIKLLLQGSANRKVAATNMNRESSRSHSVFTCVIESKWECDSVINTRFGRLNLVDLAGSERQKSSGAEGDRLKEAANINKSLSTLGLVIMVLVDAANGKPRHVPYRDSKLTFLLQDSLGGNSKTTIMATISPSNSCSMETLSTLKFAQRAKFIRNNAVVNEDTYGDVIALRQQIQQLKEELNHLRSQNLGKQEAPENQGMDTNILGRLGQDILAGSLRREAAAESLAKNLTVEIDHLNRLVRQREEDAQCVKLVLRFREDKIRRMEGVTTGLIDADAYLLEENDAVMEEVKLLRTRIDHNPEVTRFAMENIRLMDELKRLEDFYDHGEREMMSSEISNLRDQLVEFLDATASHKEECRVPNHSMLLQEVEQLRSEACQYQKTVEDYENKLLYFQDQNEKLVRQNEELQEESKNLLKENHGFKRELEQSMVKIHHVEIDQEAHMNTISGLKTLLQECEENKEVEVLKCSELELQLKEALKDIQELQSNFKEAKEVQEQMEEQQLFLINELESVLQQQQNAENDSSKAILKEQLQFLQLELQKRDELRCLEREFATTITAENNNEAEKLKLEAKFQKTREELEEARELNMIFLGETARKAAIEKQMDVTRAEVEVETADTIASMHSELLTTKEKFVAANEHERVAIEHATRLTEELRNLQLENSRLTTLCDSLVKDKDLEAQELRNEWQHATNKLIDYLSEGDQALITAAKEMEDILQLSAPNSLSSHLATRIAEKQGAIEVLKLKLQEAFVIARDAQGKIRALNEATCALTELQKQQKDEMDQEVQKIRFSAAEAASRAHELEFRLRISQDNLTRTEKTAEVAFVVIKYLRESQIELGAGMDATSQRLLEKEACIKLLKCRHGRDLHMIRSLESNLAVAEERANASFIVVKHCTDVQAQLSANIDDASKLLSEKENAFAMLQQKSKAETKLLMETEMKLQAVCEELTQHEERNVDSGTKLCEYSAIISQLRESEKLWNIEKEKMLLELNSLRLESIVMRGALEDSESALRKAVVKVRDCHKEENETAAAVIDAEKQMRKTMLFFEKNLEAIMVSTIADMNKEFADLRIIHADHLDLSSDLEELRTEMVAAKQESQQYEIKFKNAESESACLAEALKVAELRSSSLMSELLTVQTSLAELTSESAEKGAAAKQQIQELKKFLEARSSEICSLQDRISNLEASSEVLISSQSEVAEMIEGEWHSAMRSVEDDLHGLVSLACYLGSNIKDELAELKFGSRDIFICCEELKAENEALKLEQEKTLQGFQSEIECIKAESNCVREAFQAAEAERLSLQKAVKDGEEKLSLSECKILELSSELERSQEKCEVVEKDCMAAVAEMNDLDLKIQELDDHIIHLEEENGVMKKESENQQAVIQSLEQELAKAHEYAEESITAKVSSLQEEIGRKEDLLKGLQFDMSLLQESFAEAREKKKEAEEANAHLEQELYIRTNDIQHMETILSNVRGELSCSTNSLSVMETELQTLKHMTTSLSTESTMLKENIEKLELGRIDLEGELEDRRNVIESLDLELLELSSLVEQKISESLKDLNQELNLVVRERDQLHADLLVVTEQLEMAQAVADEREVLAAEARQVAEVSKAHAEEKEREMKVLESSVGELESTINALENQVGIIKREAQMQRLLREDLEMEIQTLRHEISMGNALTVDGPSPEGGTILHFKEEIAKLNEDCVERDAQIQAYKKHITDLMTASTRQAAQHQQKIAELESVLDQARLTKVKGSSSPFKCLGLSQQMNSEIDEDLSAARRRIGELEAVAAARQTEVFILNARLAEAESMTHDVVRDLLGVKVDISNYASQLNQQHAHQNSERPSTKNDEVEVNGLRKQLQDFIAERESWLEDISRRQAEMVAARVASENLRSRDQALTAEIEILKEENTAYKKQHSELENEIRKLSGQQNLQQRIHHHAKIKEENNGLKMKNEELSTKLRRIETRFNRVNDELVRYRTANGKPQHPNFDEEEQLRNKLKEAEDDNLQMAQKLTTMCASIIQAVGNSCSESDIDPCVALESLQKLQNRLLENEQEIEDLKLKSKVAGEKRRLSELKAQASPSR